MAGHCKVIWTKEALENATAIVDYLIDNWSQREADHFLVQLKERESLLSHQPRAFPLVEKKRGYRRSMLTEQIAIYYKFEGAAIKIHALFDTRQNPDKLNLK